MSLKKAIFLFGFAVLMISTAEFAFAEDAAVVAEDAAVVAENPAAIPSEPVVITSSQQTPSQKESDIQWAWGEVVNLDSEAKKVTLKYFDYETDQEKDLVLVVDEKTTFENIQDFNALKLKDTLSIDYVIGADDKNIAKNINFEKTEVSSASVAQENISAPDASADLGQPASDSTQVAVSVEEISADSAQPPAQAETPADLSAVVNEEAASAPAQEEPAVVAEPLVSEPVAVEASQAQ